MELEIKVDITGFEKAMIGFAHEIPFATSLALNLTASQAMLAVRSNLAHYFTIRTPWVAKGITMRKSTKRDLSAYVVSRDDYLMQQIEGGPREKKGKHSAIPMIGGTLPRTVLKDVTRQSEFPRKLAEKPGFFVRKIKSKAPAGYTYGVWRRVLRNPDDSIASRKYDKTTGHFGLSAAMLRAANVKPGLELMYDMKTQVMIKPRWPLPKQVEEVYTARWEKNCADAIVRAINTSRGY